jgi:hypothetical protein
MAYLLSGIRRRGCLPRRRGAAAGPCSVGGVHTRLSPITSHSSRAHLPDSFETTDDGGQNGSATGSRSSSPRVTRTRGVLATVASLMIRLFDPLHLVRVEGRLGEVQQGELSR